tara:strand:- start:741 stop:1445 length:705 start_codon:yes stop_codon:yes gene_type:complete
MKVSKEKLTQIVKEELREEYYKMKVSKERLMQIVKEETNSYLNKMVENMDLEYEDEELEEALGKWGKRAAVGALAAAGALGGGDAQAGKVGPDMQAYQKALQMQAKKGESGRSGKTQEVSNHQAQLMLFYHAVSSIAAKTRSPAGQAFKSKLIELAVTSFGGRGFIHTDDMMTAMKQDKSGFWDNKAVRAIGTAAWKKAFPKRQQQQLDDATMKKLAAKWNKLIQQYKGNMAQK